jgi:hypothetical protein
MLHELLYEERSFFTFLLITVVLGGGAAYLAGRAAATTWRPWWSVFAYAMLLGVGVRFIHFSLFNATFVTLHYYLVDTLFALAFALAGYRITRTRQMARQYGFLNRS